MSSQAENNPATARPKPAVLPQESVKFRDIQIDAAVNFYQDPEDWTNGAIASLVTDLIDNGLLAPQLVQGMPDGKYVVSDCHRRYHAAQRVLKTDAGVKPAARRKQGRRNLT